jgi:hypothetical protein
MSRSTASHARAYRRRMRNRSPARALAVVVAAALSPSCATGGTAGSDALNDAERAAFDTASAATLCVQQLGVLADNLFDFGFAIDPRASDVGNAQNLAFALSMRLQGCGTATSSGARVTADFTSTGCPARNGTQITGTFTLTLSRVGPDTVIAVDFPIASIDGFAISGTASFASPTGSRFAVTGSVTGGGITVTIGDRAITYDGSGNAFTIAGNVSITDGANTSSAIFADVGHTLGDCYVHAGTATVTRAATTESLAFDPHTATAGTVTVTSGDRAVSSTLLAFGRCPAS